MRIRSSLSEHPLALVPLLLALLVAPCWSSEATDPYWEYRDEVDKGEFSYDDSQDVPWIENETPIPAPPVVEELHRLNMDLLPREFSLYIDLDRITVGPDDYVVRTWLWVRSEHGNETGTFEGFRCETGEYKVYAYANPRREPPVRVHKRAKWRPAAAGIEATYRSELLRDYFCGIRGTRPAREIQAQMSGQFKREYFLSE